MKVRNLTAHTIELFTPLGVSSIFPDGLVARVRTGRWQTDESLPVPLIDVIQGAIIDLPDPQEGVYLIVSTYVAQHYKLRGRRDVIAPCPHTAMRNQNGEITAIRNFVRYR